MYIDQILTVVGAVLLVVAGILAVWLITHRKRDRELRRMLREETERIDVVDTLRSTIQMEKNTLEIKKASTTEFVSNRDTEILPEEEMELGKTEILPSSGIHLQDERTQTDTTDLLPSPGINPRDDATETVAGAARPRSDHTYALAGQYELIREIHGGAMSRVYVGRSVKLGNDWIVKYVSNDYALANEADVLKRLNHISLPQIIDIIPAKYGTFLVERFVEGYSLEQAMALENKISESLICDWGIQLGQVLKYLHTLETPIIHCDMKPSNIMVTYDNRLVLIDFGISRLEGKGIINGITPDYAAPEQFTGSAARSDRARRRFGELPPESSSWKVDVRTDIYSTGVILFKLITGRIPEAGRTGEIYKYVSRDLAKVVLRCIEVDPGSRIQTDDEFIDALEKVRQNRMAIPRTLLIRRIAAVGCAVALLGGTAITASGAYIGNLEDSAIISMEPTVIAVTRQQGIALKIQKTGGFGGDKLLTPADLTWTFDDQNIASVDNDRLVGINVGNTVLHGEYRGKTVELRVKVTEPAVEMTEISLRYPEGTVTSVFAGDGQRESLDGKLLTASFVSPESMADEESGLYVSDSGILRPVIDGRVSSLTVEPFYFTVNKVRTGGGKTYILTGTWEDVDGSYYGIAELANGIAKPVYTTQAAWSITSDFLVAEDRAIWLVQKNIGTGVTGLYRLAPEDLELTFWAELPEGADSIAMDEAGALYISVPGKGIVVRLPAVEKKWDYFAGVEDERNFIDGPVANFYEPTSLVCAGDALYVLDFDTVRKITVVNGAAVMTETVAGLPVADTAPAVKLGAGEETILPSSRLAELVLDGSGRLLLSDPKNSVIYEISEKEN